MSNPSLTADHGFKTNCAIFFVAIELTMKCSRKVLPTLMHEHWGLSSTLYQTLKPLQLQSAYTSDSLTLTHRRVVINKISRDTVSQHVQCGGDLLGGAMAKLSSLF
jgi:hypothetical protein